MSCRFSIIKSINLFNCTNSQALAHIYSCDIRSVSSANCKSKLLVSRCNRFDVSNLLDEIRFALSCKFECWISYTRLLFKHWSFLRWSRFFHVLQQRFIDLCICMLYSWSLKNRRDRDLRIDFCIYETWRIVVIAIFASNILSFFSIFSQSALKIWKSFSWVTQKKHDLMTWLFVAFTIESLNSYNSQFSSYDWQLIDDNKIWIWVNINLFISQYQSLYLSIRIEIDELFEREND